MLKACPAFTKSVDPAARTVEQIVSVFNNVDLGGDRVNVGAFADSLAKWAGSGNVLPAYFSHQWDDPFSNIGGVIEAKELAPGDELLPDDQVVTDDGKTLRDLGGLYVKYQFDPEGENPKADQVFRILSKRRMTQASFAYDVVQQKRNSDGTNDLVKLNLIEVGPTLLGMNPATEGGLLSAKSLQQLHQLGITDEQVKAVVDALSKDVSHTFVAGIEDASRCSFPDCGKTIGAQCHVNRLSSDGPDGTKAVVSLTGSVEERQSSIFGLADAWAQDNNVGNGGYYATHLEATFDDHVVFCVEGWNDPWGQGEYFQASVEGNEDGTLSLGDPEAVNIEAVVVPKSRFVNAASKMALKATIRGDDETKSKSEAKAEAIGNAEGDQTGDESKSAKSGEAELLRIQADLALTEL